MKKEPLKCGRMYCTKICDTMFDMITHKRSCAFQCGVCGVMIVKDYKVEGHVRECEQLASVHDMDWNS